MQIEEIYKRNHLKKPFLTEKITEAVLKAMRSVEKEAMKTKISNQVCKLIERKNNIPYYIPNVEEIQDSLNRH